MVKPEAQRSSWRIYNDASPYWKVSARCGGDLHGSMDTCRDSHKGCKVVPPQLLYISCCRNHGNYIDISWYICHKTLDIGVINPLSYLCGTSLWSVCRAFSWRKRGISLANDRDVDGCEILHHLSWNPMKNGPKYGNFVTVFNWWFGFLTSIHCIDIESTNISDMA